MIRLSQWELRALGLNTASTEKENENHLPPLNQRDPKIFTVSILWFLDSTNYNESSEILILIM